jgi:HEAT repeat protein
MNEDEIHECLTALDGRSAQGEYEAIARLEASGINVPELLLRRYRTSRRWSDRALCLRLCTRYAKSDEPAFHLGILALDDRSKIVRQKACLLLAATQSKEAVGHLERLLSDPGCRENATSAIRAIEKAADS